LHTILNGYNELFKYSEEMTGIQEIGDVMNVCLLGNHVCLPGNAVCLQATSSLLGLSEGQQGSEMLSQILKMEEYIKFLHTVTDGFPSMLKYQICNLKADI
jgi:hypothetical protein